MAMNFLVFMLQYEYRGGNDVSITKRKESFYDNEKGQYYFFDNVSFWNDYVSKYEKVGRESYHNEIERKVLRSSDKYSFGKVKSSKTFKRLIDFCISDPKMKISKPNIETIKQASYAMTDKAYAYLIKIPENINDNEKEKQCATIHNKFVKILNKTVESHFFSYNPIGHSWGKEYYCKQVDLLSGEIHEMFWDDEKTRKVLLQLCDDIKVIISYSSIPGTPESWERINPKISYFDPVYYFLYNEPELYQKVHNNQIKNISFRFYPTKEEIQNQKEYFKKYEEMKDKNVDIIEEELYQNELIETLDMIFMKNFKTEKI